MEVGGREEGSADLQREREALRLEGEAAEEDKRSESHRRQLGSSLLLLQTQRDHKFSEGFNGEAVTTYNVIMDLHCLS